MQLESFKVVLVAIAVLAALAFACSSSDDGGQAGAVADSSGGVGSSEAYKLTQQFDMSIEVSSTKFNETTRIPRKYSCEQDDVSVPITWSDVPEGTVSLALLMESDEKGSGSLWTHWLLWGIPPDARGLPEAVPNTPAVPSVGANASQGTNSNNVVGWSGPCKELLLLEGPVAIDKVRLTSDYFFRLYALDINIAPGADAKKDGFLRAIDGHVLAGGDLVGQQTRQTRISSNPF